MYRFAYTQTVAIDIAAEDRPFYEDVKCLFTKGFAYISLGLRAEIERSG